MRGYRFCSIRVPRESRATALLVLARYPFLMGDPRETSEGVAYTIDLGALPDRSDGPAAELMVMREVERAVSLHAVP